MESDAVKGGYAMHRVHKPSHFFEELSGALNGAPPVEGVTVYKSSAGRYRVELIIDRRRNHEAEKIEDPETGRMVIPFYENRRLRVYEGKHLTHDELACGNGDGSLERSSRNTSNIIDLIPDLKEQVIVQTHQ